MSVRRALTAAVGKGRREQGGGGAANRMPAGRRTKPLSGSGGAYSVLGVTHCGPITANSDRRSS